MKLKLIFYSLLTYLITGMILYFLFGPYSLVFMTAILLLDGFLMLRYGNSVSWKVSRSNNKNETNTPGVIYTTDLVDFQFENTPKQRYNNPSNPKRITITLEDGTKKRIKNPNYIA